MPTTGLPPLGATITAEGTQFAVWSRNAARIDLCLFDKTGARQLRQLPMLRNGDVHTLTVADAVQAFAQTSSAIEEFLSHE